MSGVWGERKIYWKGRGSGRAFYFWAGRGRSKSLPSRRGREKGGAPGLDFSGVETGKAGSSTSLGMTTCTWGMKRKNKTNWIKGCKERGEWAELCFMARAAGLGLGVLKPYGESGRYDVAVENGGRILRVQVKSTIYCRRGGEYSLNVMGPGRKKYAAGTVDFFAVFVIPLGEWYIIPYEAMGKRLTLHFTPGSKRSKWTGYREAWDLLRVIEIQACADPMFLAEEGAGALV